MIHMGNDGDDSFDNGYYGSSNTNKAAGGYNNIACIPDVAANPVASGGDSSDNGLGIDTGLTK